MVQTANVDIFRVFVCFTQKKKYLFWFIKGKKPNRYSVKKYGLTISIWFILYHRMFFKKLTITINVIKWIFSGKKTCTIYIWFTVLFILWLKTHCKCVILKKQLVTIQRFQYFLQLCCYRWLFYLINHILQSYIQRCLSAHECAKNNRCEPI